MLALGLFSGTYGAMIGAGGGFIIVPILLFAYPDKSAAVIAATSLVAVLANGIAGAQSYARQKRIDYKTGIMFACITIPAAIVGALVVSYIPRSIFQVVFGSLLLAVSSFIMVRPGKPAAKGEGKGSYRKITDSEGTVYEYRVAQKLGLAFSGSIGFLAALLGVGGGIMIMPLFITVLSVPIHIATATSQFILVGTSLSATITNLAKGSLNGQWLIVLALSVGAIVGARFGAKLSQKVGSTLLARALALGLMVASIRLLIAGISTL